MSLMDRLRERNQRPGPGVESEPPSSGFNGFFFIFFTHFFKFIELNLLFILFCLPVVTIPSAIAGATRVLMQLRRTGACFLWHDFWQEFKTDFLSRAIFGLALIALPAVLYYVFSFIGSPAIGGGVAIAFGALCYVLGCYWAVLVSTIDLPLSANVRNALAIIPLEWKRSLLLLFTALAHVAMLLLFPYSAPVLLLLSFSMIQYCVCMIVWPAVERRAVKSE